MTHISDQDHRSGVLHLPVPVKNPERIVREGFWPKLRRIVGHIPFSDDIAAAYFCAIDPATPPRVRAVLFAAAAYFVIPVDAMPDFVAGFGFTDDATVLSLALGLVSGYVKERHRERARSALFRPQVECEK